MPKDPVGRPHTNGHNDDLKREIEQLRSALNEANKNTMELLHSSGRFAITNSPYGAWRDPYMSSASGVLKNKRQRPPPSSMNPLPCEVWRDHAYPCSYQDEPQPCNCPEVDFKLRI